MTTHAYVHTYALHALLSNRPSGTNQPSMYVHYSQTRSEGRPGPIDQSVITGIPHSQDLSVFFFFFLAPKQVSRHTHMQSAKPLTHLPIPPSPKKKIDKVTIQTPQQGPRRCGQGLPKRKCLARCGHFQSVLYLLSVF
jgi:hypothetical protein